MYHLQHHPNNNLPFSSIAVIQDQLPPSPVFAPMQWKRAHLLWASLVMQCLLVGIWEFSYSNTFATYVYQFIVGFKIAQVRIVVHRTDGLFVHKLVR